MVEQWDNWSHANPKDAHLLPIAHNVMSDWVFLDLNPSPKRTVGRLMIQRRDSKRPSILHSSFASWLGEFAGALEDGEFVYSEEHGGLVYEDELDLD
jgi:cell wall assembly regulator SMI1